MSKAKQSV